MANSKYTNPRLKETFHIFIGSSSESKSIAKILSKELEAQSKKEKINLVSVPWYDYFESEEKVINETFLDIFQNQILEKCDFSVFIVSKDDMLIKRSEVKHSARDNVWLEAGMFIGKRGSKRTYFFLNDNDRVYMHFPTDISGLTIPGVKWDSEIVNLYLGNNVLLSKHSTVKNAVEDKIKDQISSYCEKLVKKIKGEINKRVIEEDATIITERNECFKKGKQLVSKAKERLYTTIAFKKSLSNGAYKQEMQMEDVLIKKINDVKDLSFKRYMKLDIEGINQQFDRLKKIINENGSKAELYSINFDYIEMIISDNNVLLVFPDYRGHDKSLHEKVAFGLLVKENKELSDVLSEWLINKIADTDNKND
jgi:predicted nucleotide-binding protein